PRSPSARPNCSPATRFSRSSSRARRTSCEGCCSRREASARGPRGGDRGRRARCRGRFAQRGEAAPETDRLGARRAGVRWRPANRPQDLSPHRGKRLSLFVNRWGVSWKVAGYGLWNPWRFSWERVTHDLYIGDVGQDTGEEVGVRTPRQQRVLNPYGWRVWEG